MVTLTTKPCLTAYRPLQTNICRNVLQTLKTSILLIWLGFLCTDQSLFMLVWWLEVVIYRQNVYKGKMNVLLKKAKTNITSTLRFFIGRKIPVFFQFLYELVRGAFERTHYGMLLLFPFSVTELGGFSPLKGLFLGLMWGLPLHTN